MRVAAIYDVHANLPALEAVLVEIEQVGVDLIIVGGDVVPGPMPRETLAALRNLPAPARFVHGNGERDVLAALDGADLARLPEQAREAVRWTGRALSIEDITELRAWPGTVRIGIVGLGDVLFCHATPRSDREIFTGAETSLG